MIQIPMISSAPLDRQTIQNSHYTKTKSAFSSETISQLNYQSARQSQPNPYPYEPTHTQNSSYAYEPPRTQNSSYNYKPTNTQNSSYASPAPHSSARPQPVFSNMQTPSPIPIPQLLCPTLKGQKTALETNERLSRITAGFGWNVLDSRCDVDVSAFLLGTNGKVIGDSWFVFYGQTQSPDGSTKFLSSSSTQTDREYIKIDLSRLNPAVSRIIFVLTINEALQNRLNFSMLQDAYVRILNDLTGQELVSFKMTEYYSNVNSMMIGEIYQHNGLWKFNAIGNGVAHDLAGLCELYGVQTC